jgi:LysR family hydrogen peroxide-inducible transcriptional activator
MPTLKQLQCLVAVSETLHFGRAAERCHITQPALSSQIRTLEDALGVMLIERTRHRVLMTPLGDELTARATQILRDVTDFTETARRSSKPFNGILRLGLLPTLGPYLLPHVLPALRREYGDLKLYLREQPAGRLHDDLEAGEIDAMVVSFDAPPPGSGTLLFREPFWAALPLSHPLADKTILEPGDLTGEKLLLLEEGHCMRGQILAFCEREHAMEHAGFRATSLDSLRQMVASGLGMTLLPALYAEAEAFEDEQIAVRPFRAPPTRQIGMTWRASSAYSAECLRLSKLMRIGLPPVVFPVEERGIT